MKLLFNYKIKPTCQMLVKALIVSSLFASGLAYAFGGGPKDDKTITVGSVPTSMQVGDTATVSATATGSEAVTVSVSGSACALVGGATSPVQIKANGYSGTSANCTVTFASDATQNYEAAENVTRTISITKQKPVITVSSPTEGTVIQVGSGFTAKAQTDVGLEVKIGVSGSCTGSGTDEAWVTMSAFGTCTINYSARGNSTYQDATDKIITVRAAQSPQEIHVITPSEGQLFGLGQEIVAQATTPSGIVSIDAVGACQVKNSNGQGRAVIESISQGECRIAFNSGGSDSYGSAEEVVRHVTIKQGAQSIIPTALPKEVAFGKTLTASAMATSGLPVTIVVNGDGCVVENEGEGEVTFTMPEVPGTCTVTYSQGGNDNYDEAASIALSVNSVQIRPTIVVTQPIAARLGDNFSVYAVLEPLDTEQQTRSIQVSTNGQCSVVTQDDQPGLVNATIAVTAPGVCTVFYTFLGTNTYAEAYAEKNTRVTLVSDGSNITDIWGPKVLFTAKAAANGKPQPITAAPAVSRDPNIRSKQPNLMVMFGTGLYEQVKDLSNIDQQSFYVVHDRGDLGLNRYATVGDNQTALAKREFKEVNVGGVIHRVIKGDVRDNTTEAAPVDWQNQYGWYIDLTAHDVSQGDGSERSVFSPIVAGNLLSFSTIIPQRGACSGATRGAIVQLDWSQGLAPRTPTYDVNGDGVIDSADLGYVGAVMEGISQISFSQDKIYYTVDDDIYMQEMQASPILQSKRVGWEERTSIRHLSTE